MEGERHVHADARRQGAQAVRLQISPLAKAWLELIEKDTEMAPATLAMHKGNIANHVVPGLGRLKPSELTTGTLRRWIRELRAKLEPSTVRNTFNTLARMLDNAMGEEWITLPANPARHPAVRDELPTVLAPEEVPHLSPAQASTLIRASADRGLRYLVAVTTGLRDGELSALRWENLDDELGVKVWRVSRNLAIVGPDGFAFEKTTKTRAGKQLVPVRPHRTSGSKLGRLLAGHPSMVARPNLRTRCSPAEKAVRRGRSQRS